MRGRGDECLWASWLRRRLQVEFGYLLLTSSGHLLFHISLSEGPTICPSSLYPLLPPPNGFIRYPLVQHLTRAPYITPTKSAFSREGGSPLADI